jgi:hypothetical protein
MPPSRPLFAATEIFIYSYGFKTDWEVGFFSFSCASSWSAGSIFTQLHRHRPGLIAVLTLKSASVPDGSTILSSNPIPGDFISDLGGLLLTP